MGFDPISLGIMGAAASGALSIGQASSRNRQIDSQSASLSNAARVQAGQLADQRSQQLQERRIEAAQLAGRLATQTAGAGVGFGTTYAGLDNTIATSLARSSTNIERNYQNSLLSLQAGTQLSQDQLDSQRQNEFLTGLTGGLAGLTTGLQIGQAAEQFKPKTVTRMETGYYGIPHPLTYNIS